MIKYLIIAAFAFTAPIMAQEASTDNGSAACDKTQCTQDGHQKGKKGGKGKKHKKGQRCQKGHKGQGQKQEQTTPAAPAEQQPTA